MVATCKAPAMRIALTWPMQSARRSISLMVFTLVAALAGAVLTAPASAQQSDTGNTPREAADGLVLQDGWSVSLPGADATSGDGAGGDGAGGDEAAGADPWATSGTQANGAARDAAGTDASAPGNLRLLAKLQDGGPTLTNGLVWRIFDADAVRAGTARPLHETSTARPAFSLQPGQYVLNVAYGRAHATRLLAMDNNGAQTVTLVLNAGGVRFSGTTSSGLPIPPHQLRFDVFSQTQDQFGQREVIMRDVRGGLIVRLNAGFYHVVARYGDANARIDADISVEPGQITEITANYRVARVTLKLVDAPGGEALPGTRWSIYEGEKASRVVSSVGALPSHILAEGQYTVVAERQGRTFERRFSINPGEEGRQIEVVTGL